MWIEFYIFTLYTATSLNSLVSSSSYWARKLGGLLATTKGNLKLPWAAKLLRGGWAPLRSMQGQPEHTEREVGRGWGFSYWQGVTCLNADSWGGNQECLQGPRQCKMELGFPGIWGIPGSHGRALRRAYVYGKKTGQFYLTHPSCL